MSIKWRYIWEHILIGHPNSKSSNVLEKNKKLKHVKTREEANTDQEWS